MNSYSDACMSHVADNMDKIYRYISQNLNKGVCQPLGFCDAKQTKVCTCSICRVMCLTTVYVM